MIYFFDKDLNIVDHKNELSFSYNKKVNREGTGKIEVEGSLHKDALYISIYAIENLNEGATLKNLKYIASGFIAEIQINDKTVSISFNTFEGLLKNSKLPKVFNNFNSMKKMEVFYNLFHAFQPIIKSKKSDFSNISSGYAFNAGYSKGILKADNIVFSKVKDGDFHLAFNKDYLEKNEYRYCEQGQVIFFFDLGKPKPFNTCHSVLIPEGSSKILTPQYPSRFLRFTASLGNKTFINVKAISQDEPFIDDSVHIKEYTERLKNASYLKFDRSIKDFEKNIGVALPLETNKNRFLALQFIFIYEKPDWIQDFSTLEVYDSAGALQKRTVRGFTPVLHGLEILNRRDINPFPFANTIFYFDSDIEKKEFEQDLLSAELNAEAKLKFDGLSLYDALIKILDETKYNLQIKLYLSKTFNKTFKSRFSIQIGKNDFNVSRFKEAKKEFINENHILRLQEGENSRLNNFILKALKQKTMLPKMLHCYGEGEGQDILYLCLFNEWQKKDDGTFEEKIKLLTSEAIGDDDPRFAVLNSFSVGYSQTLPNVSFEEAKLEDGNIKDFNSLLKKGIEYFIDEEKKKDYSFELDSTLPLDLYDKVLVYYQNGNFELKANVIEVKINYKNSILKKTFGIGGFLFNPFSSLFQKPIIDEVIRTPKKPFNLKAFTKEGYLYLTWDCLGVYDGFMLTARRLDDECFSSKRKEKEAIFYSSVAEIKLNAFDEKVLYSLNVCSYIGNIKSDVSYSIYFKMLEGKKEVYILNSLFEKGHSNGQRAFYLDVEKRNNEAFQKELCRILKLKPNDDGSENIAKLKKINDFDSDPNTRFFSNYFQHALFEEDEEKVRSFLGNEYVWQNGEWVDVRVRPLNRTNILLMFEFRRQDITFESSDSYSEEGFKNWERFIDALHVYENARQLLNCLSLHYKLPEGSNNPITYKAIGKPLFNGRGGVPDLPIVPNPPKPPKPITPDPIFPPINPDPPQKPIDPPEDRRYIPDEETKKLWNKTLKEYEAKKDKLEDLAKRVRCFKGAFLDLSAKSKNLTFNFPNFAFLKKEWIRKEKKYNFHTGEGYYDCAGFLDNAIRFYWQSTNKDGEFNKGKPSYQIKKIGLLAGERLIEFPYTLSFYLKVEKAEGDIEVWNIGNYCIGRLLDGVLHFCCKKKDGGYHTFYKMKCYDRQYSHVMIVFSISNVISTIFEGGIFKGKYSTTITQKIFIDFKEVKLDDYENKSFLFQEENKEKNFNFAEYEFSLFNFEQKNRSEEDYSNFKKSPYSIHNFNVKDEYYYLKSAYFDVKISHLILYRGVLDYGMRQYLKKHIFLSFEEKKEDKKNEKPITQGKNEKDSKYKGVCDGRVEEKKVHLYEKGEVEFNEEEFFLMAHKFEGFSSGVIYRWTGSFWQELLPYSLYHKEYMQAYQDIQNMSDLPSNVFFKEFLMGVLQVCDVLYSKTMQANLLTIQEGLFFSNIPKEDPHIKGQVYLSGAAFTSGYVLKVSEG